MIEYYFLNLFQQQLPPPPTPEEAEDIVKQGRLNKLQLLQFHQAVLESQTRAWLQTQDNEVRLENLSS